MTDSGRPRRAYDSSRRRESAAETRERIVAVGMELLHRYPIWNWQPLTVPAVAHRAGVTERTVYRHFPTERALRDAVLERTAEDVDVDLDAMTLDTVEGFTARVLEYVASFPVKDRQQRDPTVVAARARQREALLRAVAASTAWAEPEVRTAAAMLDVLWSVMSFEQLVTEWGMPPQDAIDAITWVIRVLRDAIREDHGPRS